MRYLRVSHWLALALIIVFAGALFHPETGLAFGEGQGFGAGAKAKPPETQDPLTARARFQPSRVEAGGTVELFVDMNLDPGFHAYLDRFKISIESPDDLRLSDQKITPVVTFKDAITKQEKQGVAGQAKLTALVEVPMGFRESKHEVKIKFVYQACTDEYCLFPVTKNLSAPLEVGVHGAVLEPLDPATRPVNELEKALKKGSLAAFLLVFAVGFLTCLTPCIYPMIPITLAVLGARAKENSHARNFSLAVTYVLGIAITYAILGVVAALTGGLVGAALSSPWVVTVIGLVFVAMGLSMFGLFDLQPPAFVRDRLGAARTGTGYFGAFSTGLLAGVVASPCVGPVLVSVLTYIAQTRSHFLGFWLLFTFAIGMGLPFLALGLSSSWITRLPKAGPWMSGVKYLFGVVMIGMAFYYVRPVYEPMIARWFNSDRAATPNSKATSLMNWQPYSIALLEQAIEQKKPVLIDFTAEWCAACYEMEESTFVDPRVVELSRSFVLLKVDGTEDTPALRTVIERYQVRGFPTYVFFDRSGNEREDLRGLGYIQAEDFAKLMSAALL